MGSSHDENIMKWSYQEIGIDVVIFYFYRKHNNYVFMPF